VRSAQRAAESILAGFLVVGVQIFITLASVAFHSGLRTIGDFGSLLGAGCVVATIVGFIVIRSARAQAKEMKQELEEEAQDQNQESTSSRIPR
jgi:hypothetical protein